MCATIQAKKIVSGEDLKDRSGCRKPQKAHEAHGEKVGRAEARSLRRPDEELLLGSAVSLQVLIHSFPLSVFASAERSALAA